MATRARRKRPPKGPGQNAVAAVWQAMREARLVSGRCPAEMAVADFLTGPDCPLDAREEAEARLAAVLREEIARWYDDMVRTMSREARHAEDVLQEEFGGVPARMVHDAPPGVTLGEIVLKEKSWPDTLARIRDHLPHLTGIEPTRGAPRTIQVLAPNGIRTLAEIHALWSGMSADQKPKHPLAPILLAWYRREGPLFQPAQRGALMEWHRADTSDMRLLDPGDAPPLSDEVQMVLPLFDSAIQDDGAVSWLLALYELSGGNLDKVKGLPPALVMAVGAIAHLHVRSRDSDFRRLYFPSLIRHKENWRGDRPPPWDPDNPPLAIEEWLYPNGGMARPSRDWTRIRDGLQDMGKRLAYLPIPGLGDVAWLFPGVIPQSIDDQVVEIVIRIPESAANGTRFDWPLFLQYASRNARKARAYLSAVAIMGRSAHDGEFQTRQLPARVLDQHGNPVRKPGGRYSRDLALGLEDNPHARYVRALSDRALARMCGFRNPTKLQLKRARDTFAELEADGVLEFVRDDNGYRLFGPTPRTE